MIHMNDKQLLVDIEHPASIFVDDKVDAVLRDIKSAVSGVVFNIDNEKGRRECASLANRVARSKTFLDKAGKDLVAEWKIKAGAVDAQRRNIRNTLDKLKVEVRAPLTAWEETVAREKQLRSIQITSIKRLGETANASGENYSSDDIERRIALLEKRPVPDTWFGDLLDDALLAYKTASSSLENALVCRRTEEAKRDQEIKEIEIRRQRDEKARIEKAKADAVAAERRLHAQALARAEKEKEFAVAAANKQAAEDQERAERERVAAENKKNERTRLEREAKMAREADAKHRDSVFNDIVSALSAVGCETSENVALAIVNGQIPCVLVHY